MQDLASSLAEPLKQKLAFTAANYKPVKESDTLLLAKQPSSPYDTMNMTVPAPTVESTYPLTEKTPTASLNPKYKADLSKDEIALVPA